MEMIKKRKNVIEMQNEMEKEMKKIEKKEMKEKIM